MTISLDMLRAILMVLERGKWDMTLAEMVQLGTLHRDLLTLYRTAQPVGEATTGE